LVETLDILEKIPYRSGEATNWYDPITVEVMVVGNLGEGASTYRSPINDRFGPQTYKFID
jgi:hypothetical protein